MCRHNNYLHSSLALHRTFLACNHHWVITVPGGFCVCVPLCIWSLSHWLPSVYSLASIVGVYFDLLKTLPVTGCVLSFRVFVTHRILTWTTGSLTCVRDHSYAYTHRRGLRTQTVSQLNIFDSEMSCADGVWTLNLESDASSTSWVTPSPYATVPSERTRALFQEKGRECCTM